MESTIVFHYHQTKLLMLVLLIFKPSNLKAINTFENKEKFKSIDQGVIQHSVCWSLDAPSQCFFGISYNHMKSLTMKVAGLNFSYFYYYSLVAYFTTANMATMHILLSVMCFHRITSKNTMDTVI